MAAFTDSQGNVLISASDVAAHVSKLMNGGFIRSYGPSPEHKLVKNYYSLYRNHLDKEGGGNFCDCIDISSPQGNGLIIYPVGVHGSKALADQDINAWNAAASKAAGLRERY